MAITMTNSILISHLFRPNTDTEGYEQQNPTTTLTFVNIFHVHLTGLCHYYEPLNVD